MDLFDCSIVEGMDSIIRAIMERDAFHDRNVAILEAYRRSIYHLYQDHVRLVKLSIVRDAARTDEQIKKERKKADDATGTRLFIKGHLRPRFLEAFRCVHGRSRRIFNVILFQHSIPST